MNKKNYIIIVATALIFIVAIIAILLSKDNSNWTTEILNAQSYEISMLDCNGREKTLDNNTITSLSDKWGALSNNGPWMGDNNTCYTTVTISYENNGIVNTKEIMLIDDTSIAFIEATGSIYYTQAGDIISHLNSLFTK